LEQDQPGIEGRLGTNFGKVGISLFKNVTEVMQDGSARLILMFRLLSSVQRRQIFNIIGALLKEVPGTIVGHKAFPEDPTKYTLSECLKLLSMYLK
jgi:hypothetical protein